MDKLKLQYVVCYIKHFAISQLRDMARSSDDVCKEIGIGATKHCGTDLHGEAVALVRWLRDPSNYGLRVTLATSGSDDDAIRAVESRAQTFPIPEIHPTKSAPEPTNVRPTVGQHDSEPVKRDATAEFKRNVEALTTHLKTHRSVTPDALKSFHKVVMGIAGDWERGLYDEAAAKQRVLDRFDSKGQTETGQKSAAVTTTPIVSENQAADLSEIIAIADQAATAVS